MKKLKPHLTLVNFLVGLAVLMILSALVVPIFIPPQGKAASRVAASCVSAKSAKH